MKAARRRKVAALAVFSLIACVVLGGIIWASLSTYELAKSNLQEEYWRRISLAQAKMSAVIGGLTNTETGRDWEDYLAFHDKQSVESRALDEPFPAFVKVASPLLESSPSYHWIDLYFQYEPTSERLISPQLPEQDKRWMIAHIGRDPNVEMRARRAWDWFESVAFELDFAERIAASQIREEHLFTVSNDLADEAEILDQSIATPVPGQVSREYMARARSLSEAQLKHEPLPACETLEVLDQNVSMSFSADGPAAGEQITVRVNPIAPPFWLDTPPEVGRKLAFVRLCTAEAGTKQAHFYQGFVVDWELLKFDLLRQIEGIFPEGPPFTPDLIPIPDDVIIDAETSRRKLTLLPALIEVPFAPEAVSAAAWASVKGVLFAGWAAALAVLGVAGWGVRNLVALTERRMQFAYAVTHELRTPLTTFRLYSDMLAAGLVPEQSRQEYLDTLVRESGRLSALVEEVLEYARLENQRARLYPTQVEGVQILSRVGETLRERCRDLGIEPLTENAIHNGRLFHVDVDVINRIASVLISNACRHTRSRDVKKIMVRLGAEKDELLLDVVDSGPGIELGEARSIFKPFRRGRNADATAQGGIGLGLALARDWATMLGGRLDLISRHHPQLGGAHFRLTIPARMRPRAG